MVDAEVNTLCGVTCEIVAVEKEMRFNLTPKERRDVAKRLLRIKQQLAQLGDRLLIAAHVTAAGGTKRSSLTIAG